MYIRGFWSRSSDSRSTDYIKGRSRHVRLFQQFRSGKTKTGRIPTYASISCLLDFYLGSWKFSNKTSDPTRRRVFLNQFVTGQTVFVFSIRCILFDLPLLCARGGSLFYRDITFPSHLNKDRDVEYSTYVIFFYTNLSNWDITHRKTCSSRMTDGSYLNELLGVFPLNLVIFPIVLLLSWTFIL